MRRALLTVAAAVPLLCGQAAAQPVIETKAVDLTGGVATEEGRITGYEIVDYRMALAPGARIEVELTSDNRFNFFNLLAPGETEVAFFVGAREGDRFEGVVGDGGDYTARIFLMRNAARRNEEAAFTFSVAILSTSGEYADGDAGGPDFWEVANLSPGGSVNMRAEPSTGSEVLMRFSNGAILRNLGCRTAGGERWCEVARPDAPEDRGFVSGAYLREGAAPVPTDATVEGTPFHATGTLPCDAAGGCRFGVIRMGGGTAALSIERPDGERRIIHFQSGETVMVEDAKSFASARVGDLTTISLDGESYEVPDVVIYGD